MLTKRKKQDIWLTQAQYDALQTLEDGVVYHITDEKVDYSTEVSNRPILKTDNTTAQSTSASETITGTINLHKVAKTGNYPDLNNLPTLGTAAAKDAGTQNGVADLDANGKVPVNELPIDAKTGATAPTTSTAADYVGQWYLDTTNNKTYQCTAITSDGATPPTYTYTWVEMARKSYVSDNFAEKDAGNLSSSDASAWAAALGIGSKADKDASNLTDANVTSFNTKLGNDWHTFTGSAGTAITISVNFDKVKEFAFRVLGGDNATFGYLSIPKDIWYNNGTYGLSVTCFDNNGYRQGSVDFVCADKQTNSFKINSTNHGTNGSIAVSVKY